MFLIKTTPILLLLFLIPASALPGETLFRENFASLTNWKPLTFPKIPKHSRYDIIREDEKTMLRARADASASGIIYKKTFNVFDYPVARWRWKISNVFQKGNAATKAGDDYPIRVYFIFRYDPDKAAAWMRARYGAVKLIYGEYPPHSSLNYIWANRDHRARILTSAYTDRAKMVLLKKGASLAGQWVEERVNILADYRAAFGEDPPAEAGIAIMSDADNTGESAEAFMDFIEVGK